MSISALSWCCATAGEIVIPGRVEDANPESRDSGFDAIGLGPLASPRNDGLNSLPLIFRPARPFRMADDPLDYVVLLKKARRTRPDTA